ADKMPVEEVTFSPGPQILSHGFNFFWRIKGIIGMSFFYKFLSVFFINVFSLALPVGCIWPFMVRAFIGLDPAPVEAINYVLFCPCHIAGLIGIFDPQNEITFIFFCK